MSSLLVVSLLIWTFPLAAAEPRPLKGVAVEIGEEQTIEKIRGTMGRLLALADPQSDIEMNDYRAGRIMGSVSGMIDQVKPSDIFQQFVTEEYLPSLKSIVGNEDYPYSSVSSKVVFELEGLGSRGWANIGDISEYLADIGVKSQDQNLVGAIIMSMSHMVHSSHGGDPASVSRDLGRLLAETPALDDDARIRMAFKFAPGLGNKWKPDASFLAMLATSKSPNTASLAIMRLNELGVRDEDAGPVVEALSTIVADVDLLRKRSGVSEILIEMAKAGQIPSETAETMSDSFASAAQSEDQEVAQFFSDSQEQFDKAVEESRQKSDS